MLSNQTSRVYCDIEDMAYLEDMLSDLAEGHEGDVASMCAGAALAVDILARNRLQTAADFVAVFTARATGTPQRADNWKIGLTD